MNDGSDILEALGIDIARVVKATIHFEAGRIPAIEITRMLPIVNDTGELSTVAERYELRRIEEATDG